MKDAMIKEVTELLTALIPDIGDEYWADVEMDEPSMCVTIATTDGISWEYQTGDNSVTGRAYGYQYWGVITLTRDSDPAELATDAVEQCFDQLSLLS